MKLTIYTIFDSAAGLYMRPFYGPSDEAARRSFKDIATDKEHEVGQHPEDYSLFRIGTYEDTDAKIVILDRECISTALEMVAEQRNNATPLFPDAGKEIDFGTMSEKVKDKIGRNQERQ